MIKICVLGGHNSMQRLINRDDIEFYELYDPDPYAISIPQWGIEYTNFVNSINPDYVICINIRLSCQQCNSWIQTVKKNNMKFVMWSFDSYRHHTVFHTNADLYFYCLDDDVKKSDDKFLPVYAQPRNIIKLEDRRYNIGMIYNNYPGYRQQEISKIQHLLDLNTNVEFRAFYPTIGNLKFGLNISVYYDGLPNYRTFEYAGCGVYQICSSRNRNVLEELLPYGVSYYNNIEELPEIVNSITNYDPERIKKQVATRHTLLHRIKTIMSHFDINIRIIPEDEEVWTFEDYQKRHNVSN